MSITMTQFQYTDSHGHEITIEPNEEWVNYGDANPDRHGGIFVKWQGDMWQIVETVNGHDSPEDYCSDDESVIWEYWVEPMDLWVNGDPDNGPTDYLKGEIESLSNVASYDNAMYEFDIEYFTVGMRNYLHSREDRFIENSEYWEELENRFGITPE